MDVLGLLGGTRAGSVDPVLIFHHTPSCAEIIEENGVKMTKAEYILNKSPPFLHVLLPA